MSGGSLNYLCYDESADGIMLRTDEMERAEKELIKLGYKDVAADVRRLIEYCISAKVRIEILKENINEVFHDLEWYMSGDVGIETLEDTVERYRRGE